MKIKTGNPHATWTREWEVENRWKIVMAFECHNVGENSFWHGPTYELFVNRAYLKPVAQWEQVMVMPGDLPNIGMTPGDVQTLAELFGEAFAHTNDSRLYVVKTPHNKLAGER
jgi:hypothetical protein